MMLVTAPAGFGKSQMVDHWAVANGAAYLRAKVEWTPRYFMTELAETLKLDSRGRAKDVFGRITQFRAWWNLDWRYEHAIRTTRADVGLKIAPREGRYYYIGGSNLANLSDASTHGTDYVEKNRVDALLGFVRGPVDLGVGVIRSGGGVRLTVTEPWWKRVSVLVQGYDFGRDRVVSGRHFAHPEYDFGIMARITRIFGLGARVEDVQELKSYQTTAKVMFEDQDVAYLFGLASFGAAGTKGRSKSK